ncbi:uncharacterized protein LOC131856820 [Cryptomeria japonica]|uniref:uncharacterized protein LOC131856820 n=1 Tax=Cryptomeria japonica TaxID=3369 RepID=UPI0027DA4305|nr:uncharacterized protein LOC131856820 [Cryptomeria japonica]
MAERLNKLLPKLISEHQNSFTPGREIADSIILVSEVIHTMHKEKMSGIAVKLDVEKAYDHVIWSFLVCVLDRLGFPSAWIECIKQCISTVKFSILVNGNVCGFFPATNGLRQGGPLSPSLFVLMNEVLGKLIQKRHVRGVWKGIRVHEQLDAITHSQLADDTMVFGEATLTEAKTIMETLHLYSESSGQIMNKEKSQLFIFNTNKQTQSRISRLMGIKVAELPLNMSCFKLPAAAGKKLDNLLRKFVWDNAKDTNRIPLISWDTMCLQKESGGVGLQNIALDAKLTWKMYREPQKLWCSIFRRKFLDSNEPSRILTIANSIKDSATWNFLWDYRYIITDHISWQIGNGQSTKFRYDSWNGEMAICDLIKDPTWIQMVESQLGSFVNNYFEEDLPNTSHRRWKRVNLGSSDSNDCIFWCGSKTGEYKVNL